MIIVGGFVLGRAILRGRADFKTELAMP